ncbi:MAG TPA: glycoside hydrolase [Lachnospiraceae bacterium]|nr:glycoside hydrolase [Lachnospiraceae bacterium]
MRNWRMAGGIVAVEAVSDTVLRCVYTKNGTVQEPSELVEKRADGSVSCGVAETEKTVTLSTGKVQVEIDRAGGACRFTEKDTGRLYLQEAGKSLSPVDVIHYTTGDEAPVIDRVKTVDGERNFIRNLKPVVDRKAYRGKLSFNWAEDEAIHGLGQGEEGIYDYRHHSQYLYQHNMRIPVPFFVSTKGYGIFLDCGSLMTFNDDENGSYIFMDTVDQLDYYFIAGDSLDEIIGGFRVLTGQAAMLPRWAFGYVQSKEAYTTGDELEETARRYRDIGVPLDCIVQDWNSWEPGHWGEKAVDRERYPDLKGNMERIHGMHVHSMVSVWPNMNSCTKDYEEFMEGGHMLHDLSTYDAFSEEARALYWKQANEGLFSQGFDSWWCDSTEPFSGPDWGGEVKREPWERFMLVGKEHKQYIDAARANTFALYHARGIYENQRKTTENQRVLNLTRSGYAASQRYGTMLWSGDISASWDTLRRQIVEGLNFAMSGMPYWTLDIGAFFVVGTAWQNRGCGCNTDPTPKWFWTGGYNDGVADLGYRELYVRWLEFGVFLPMFRSHGTDTPREIWHFGKPGDIFYDAIELNIRLRYRLLPYIYSLAGAVHLQGATMMRSLLFDFADDEKVRGIADEYMFGPSLLICPVTEPMYYEAESCPIDREKRRDCYLPAGCGWVDFMDGEYYEGGRTVNVSAPLEKIPVFVRAGSIIPETEGLIYADQMAGSEITFHVYPGADGEYTYYEDEGDSYNYEKGAYSLIPLFWNETEKKFTIGERQGSYPGMAAERTFRIVCGGWETTVSYEGTATSVGPYLPR